MPNRLLREGILTSERIARLGWAEEVFYRRLMSIVDDFGRYFADPCLLRAACYPRQLDKVSDADIGKWTRCAEEAGLVSVYPASDGKRYLQLLDFRQQVRAKASKFPAPAERALSTCVADAKQVIADAHLDEDVVGDGDGGGDDKPPVVPQGGALVAEVLAAYHEALPRCMRATTQTPKRVKRIKIADRLAATLCVQQGWSYDRPKFWAAYFGECAADPWLRGDVPNPKNANWKQNIDVLLAEDRFAGIMDRAVANLQGDE